MKELAQRLLNGETIERSASSVKEKNDFEYEVYKSLLDICEDQKAINQAIVRLKVIL